MISKEDMNHILEEMKKVEIKMLHYYRDLADQIHTPFYRDMMLLTMNEEIDHEKHVNNLIFLLEKTKWR